MRFTCNEVKKRLKSDSNNWSVIVRSCTFDPSLSGLTFSTLLHVIICVHKPQCCKNIWMYYMYSCKYLSSHCYLYHHNYYYKHIQNLKQITICNIMLNKLNNSQTITPSKHKMNNIRCNIR